MRVEGVEVVIMEVSSHALHQHRADYIHFDAAVFTNLTHEHLDYHKTMKEYALAKKILFDMLPTNSIAVVCDNSEFSDYILSDCRSGIKLFVGRTDKANLRISNEKLEISQSGFMLDFKGDEKVDFAINLMGRFNIDNSAFTAAIAWAMGIEAHIIKRSLATAAGAPGRMQRIKLKNEAIGIVDYAHTPDALEKALSSCREVIDNSGAKSRLISVFGCGGDRDTSKRPLMGDISTSISDYSIITSDNPRTENPEKIIADIITGIDDKYKFHYIVIPDRSEAIKYAVNYSEANDIILVAGKGHEDYQIIGTEKRHFDDTEELQKY